MFLTALVLIGLIGPLEGPVCGSSDALTSWSGSDSSSGIRSCGPNVSGMEWSITADRGSSIASSPEGPRSLTAEEATDASNASVATSFAVGAVLPAVAITSPANGSMTSSPVVAWQGSGSGTGVTYQVSLDSDPWTGPTSATRVYFDGLGQGCHTVRVKATDGAGSSAIAEVEFILDSVPPSVVTRSPEGQEAKVGSTVSVTFSEAMDTGSVNVVVSGVIGTVSWSGNTMTFDPVSMLEAGTSYNVTVSGADPAGNQVNDSWTFTVTTLAALSGQVLDGDGNPVAGAAVTLEGGESAVTDAEGRFAFELPAGDYDLTVSREGYRSASASVVLTAGGTTSVGAISLAAEPSSGAYYAVFGALATAAVLAPVLYFHRRK